METLGQIVRFGSNAYAVRYGNYVSVFFVTPQGVILVDPCGQSMPRLPHLIREAIGLVSDQPVRYVVYSHWGADHGMGGAVFADTAEFVAHRTVAPKFASANDPTSPPPTLLISEPTPLTLGDTRIDLYPTDFHDQDDYLIVHDPASKVVLTIDFVQGKTVPFRRLFGVPSRVIDRLQWLDEKLDFEHVISGHPASGLAGTREDIREQRQYYVDLGDAVTRSNGDPAQARALLEPKYGTWRRFPEMVEDNIAGYLAWTSR